MRHGVFIGCASWSLPKAMHGQFAADGSHLQRYAARLPAVEINSSFHRPHTNATYARWAASVPAQFRFSVKLPRTITHQHKLRDCAPLVDEFLAQASGLGERLGCLLVQLPPSLALDAASAAAFFDHLRSRWSGPLSAEPRHASWFTPEGNALLAARRVARVLADPVLHHPGACPGGWDALVYLRLHGSPRPYYSSYPPELLAALAGRIARARREGRVVWCIFDNTAAGAAVDNALGLDQMLDKEFA